MIGLFYTTITTKDNRVLTLPNSQISNCAVTNCTQNPVRRLDTVVGISYESDIRLAKEIMEKTARDCQYVLQDRDITVFVDSLGDSSVDIGLFCYVNSPDFLAAKWQITEEIKLRFDEAGISIPFPQVHVHMEK
jgi:small conductance mechanosensitive channel